MAVGAEYDAGGNILRRLGSLVNRGLPLQSLHEPGAHDRAGAVDPDQAQGPWVVLRLTHHVRGPRGQVGMVHRSRRALLLLRPPFVGPEYGQGHLVSARSGEVNMLGPLS